MEFMDHNNEEETMAATPPPGFRFFPTEEELVSFYLHNKLLIASAPDHNNNNDNLSRNMDQIIPVLDIYHFNPWELPRHSGVMSRDDPEQWFFFIPRRESEERGARPNRLTTSGYWKATGSPGPVFSSGNRAIGVKRSMVFYVGRAPNGTRTEWKMNEYRALVASTAPPAIDPALIRQEFSLCRVYKKSKCLRAFDRRPWAPITDGHLQGTSQASQLAAQLGAGSSSSAAHQQIVGPTNSVAEISGSSSGAHDHTRLDQAAEGASNNLEIGAEDYDNQASFWDYDWDIASMDFGGMELNHL